MGIMACVDRYLAYLEAPLWWCSEKGARIISYYMPGKFGQYENFLEEAVARTFYFAGTSLAIVPSTGLFLVRKTLQFVLTKLSDQPFTYLCGDAPPKFFQREISVLNSNLCFLPGILSYRYGGQISWKERIDSIVSKILHENPDVLCLEEVHSEEAAFALYEKLKHNYHEAYINIGPGGFLGSGLAVFSKFRTAKPHFSVFTQTNGTQKAINKGYFTCEILANESLLILNLFHTHLFPGNSNEDREIRKQQISEIKEKMCATDYTTVLVGDLNIDENHQEYEDQIRGDFYDPLANQNKYTCTDRFEKYYNTGIEEEEHLEKLDYALLKERPNNSVNIESRVISLNEGNHPLSDHNAIYTKLWA